MEEKKQNWFRKHWIISIFLGLIVLGMVSTIFNNITSNNNDLTGNFVQEQSFALNENNNEATNINSDSKTDYVITHSLEDMLPSPSELPTEYSIGEKIDITKESLVIASRNAQEGFDSGKTLFISKYKTTGYSVTDYIEVTFGVYKFDNSDYASNFQNKIVESIKSEGGYTELSSLSNVECFASKTDFGYGGKSAGNICHRKNIIFWTDISMSNTFKQPDNYLEEMNAILEKNIY